MASLNKVMIIGRLGSDPELTYTQNNTAVAKLSVATDESYTNKATGEKVEQTEWHKVVAFGKQAENAGKYLSKGQLIYVEGSLQTQKWQDKSGNDRYTTQVKAWIIRYLERKERNGASAANERQQRAGAPIDDGGFSDDDIPF